MTKHGGSGSGGGNKHQKESSKRRPFTPNYDYEVDYNDHFETPLQAYTDILPLLDLIAPAAGGGETPSEKDINREDGDTKIIIKERQRKRKEHIIYDPYYCNGRTKTILQSLGFDKIVHEKRDFYKDIREGKVPNHHTLVTNPPYSDDHKEKCLQFCTKQFREQNIIAFFLLIPNYVAARSYYRKILGDTIHDVAYLVPDSEYSYSHPEGTGHEESPFSSLWFCCIGKERIKQLTQEGFDYRNSNSHDNNNNNNTKYPNGRSKFVASFDELISLGVISLENRPNPRQRKKMRKMAAQSEGHSATAVGGGDAGIDGTNLDRASIPRSNTSVNNSNKSKEKIKGKKGRTNSKYRNTTGERTKKRF